MEDASYNAVRWVSLSPLPGWVLGLLGLGIAASVVLGLLSLRREADRRRRWLLGALRVLAGGTVLFFLLEPGIRRLQLAKARNRVAVLVDRSASMGFPVEVNGVSRSEAARRYLESVAPELRDLKNHYGVELYGVDKETLPLALETLGTPPTASRTDLLNGLRSVAGRESGRKLAGVLVISDGADNGELSHGVTDAIAAELKGMGAPISTLSVGRDVLRDVSLGPIKVDDFAFVRNAVAVEVEVRARGYKGRSTPVVLGREGQVVATQTVSFKSDDDRQTLSFSFTPDQTGRFSYSVSTPVLEAEAISENNQRAFSLKVIRDRIRILLVVGRPSWDERFLRGLLKQDANIDLVSFYILRTLSDDPNVRNPDRELSLIPFPMDEIFDAKLHTFDVVLFQNFGYTDPQLSIESYERNLEKYVANGGALVVVGGDHAFGASGDGRASFPVLGQALPLEPTGTPPTVESFKVRLTPEGLRHPVTALSENAAVNERSWSDLPAIPGANVTRAKAGATVLLEHPFQTVQGRNVPILALWSYGRGRSMALTTDSSWYWAFLANAGGEQRRHYDRFWGNALRWLVRDPELTTLRVSADPPAVEPGSPVAAQVTARTADYQPAQGAQVKVDLQSVRDRTVVGTRTATTGADGTVRVEFPPPPAGEYKLLASARKGDQALGDGEDPVAVRALGSELSDAQVRPQLLAAIAKATGGVSMALPSSGWPKLPLLEPPTVEVGRSQDEPIWNRWEALAALALLLGLEWFLRRRLGHL